MSNRIEMMKALAVLHDEWFDEYEGEFADRFDPSSHPKEGSDYNQHNIDIDADADAYDDFARRAAEIFGTQGSLTARMWNEHDHPRDPGGEDGGKFIEKGTVGIDEGVAKKMAKPSTASYRVRMSSLRDTLSGRPEEDVPLGGNLNAGRVFKVKWSDGTWTVGKDSRDIYATKSSDVIAVTKKRQDDAEVLGPLVANTLGIRAPATMRRPGDEDWVYQEFMPGRTAMDKIDADIAHDRQAGKGDFPRPRSEFDTPDEFYNQRTDVYAKADEGIRIGLLDQILDNTDRNSGNWLIDDDDGITAIDHGMSQGWESGAVQPLKNWSDSNRFAANFSREGKWIDNPLTPADTQRIANRLLTLEPEFKKLGREDWFTNAIIRLSQISKYAKGERDLFGEEDEQEGNAKVLSLDFKDTNRRSVQGGDFSGLKKVEGRKGSNPAGLYEASDGSRWYIKQHKSEENAGNEVAANQLYHELGVDTPDVFRGTGAAGLKGPQVASEWRDLERADYENPLVRQRIQEDFAIDAWLANWDVAGTGGSQNIEVDTIGGHAKADGFPVRVDSGGALLTRASGAPKGDAFTDHVSELDTMRDPRINPETADLFRDIGDADLATALERMARIRPTKIRKIIADNELPPELAEKLIKRRQNLLDKAEQLRIDLESKKTPRQPGEPLRGRAALASTRLRLPLYEPDYMLGDRGDSESMLYDRSGQDIGVRPEIVAEWSRILRGYRGGTFKYIGDYMRHPDEAPNRFPNHPNDPNWPSNESIDMQVAHITDAFGHSPLDADLETYRGVWNGNDVFGEKWRPDGSMVGAKWVERGPTSTSPDSDVAKGFGNIIFRIKAPKGTGAIQLSDWPLPDGSSTREAEIVLQPHLRYRIVGDSLDFYGPNTRILDVEVEPLGGEEEE